MFYRIYLCLILLPSIAYGERLIGQDYLAAMQPNFRIQPAITYVKEGTPLGVLDVTFGKDLNAIERLLINIKPKYLRVHLHNLVCLRNGNCFDYEIADGYSINSFNQAIINKKPEIIKRTKNRTLKYKELSERYPGTTFLLSPGLEHNLSQGAYRVLADAVLSVWPGVQLVNSAMDCSGERYRGAWRECHGNTGAAVEINSLDGTDATDINIPAWLDKTRGNKITFVWSRSFNCRTQGSFVDPRSRSACPKAYQIEELFHITDNRGNPPSFQGSNCGNIAPFKAPSIWKPFAEDKGTGDGRANKPVLLHSGNKATYAVLSITGDVLGSLGYYGPFQGGLLRYYSAYTNGSGLGGYGFEKEAMKYGSPYVWIKQGSKCSGPFVPGRREGAYHN